MKKPSFLKLPFTTELPTNTNNLASDKWGLGPSAVALRMDGPWVYGALVNNVWSLAIRWTEWS